MGLLDPLVHVLSVAVMHMPTFPARVQNVAAMALQLPLATLVSDRGLGVWDTASRAWGLAAGSVGTTHHLVLQDDAQLCAGFYLQAQAAIANSPAAAISLMTPAATTWRNRRRYPPGVALIMPRAWCAPFVAWASALPERQKQHDNILVGRWLRRMRLPLVYSTPSIVQHGALPSTIAHRAIAAANYNAAPTSLTTTSNPT